MRKRVHLRLLLILVLATGWLSVAVNWALECGSGSDIVRQWKVCQYVLAGKNPYSISLNILRATYGLGVTSETRLFAIPQAVPESVQSEILAAVGPPEATYPPSSCLLLIGLAVLMSTPESVVLFWLAVNLLCVASAILLTARFCQVSDGDEQSCMVLLASGVAFLFFPFATSVGGGQFSVVVLVCLLASFHWRDREWLSGLMLGIALIKPTIALPFLILPVVRRQWRVVVCALLVQGGSVLAVAALVRSDPVSLVLQWVEVGRYFLQGIYTVQEIINGLGMGSGYSAIGIPLVLLMVVGCLCYRRRSAGDETMFEFLCIVSATWTYHNTYDFVVLLPLLVGSLWRACRTSWGVGSLPCLRGASPVCLLALCSFGILTLAMSSGVLASELVAARGVRWMCRLVILGLAVLAWNRMAAGSVRCATSTATSSGSVP